MKLDLSLQAHAHGWFLRPSARPSRWKRKYSDRPAIRVETVADLRLALVDLLRSRRIELRMSQLDMDGRAGFPDGYSGKLETDLSRRNHRHLNDWNLPLALGALRSDLVLFLVPKGSMLMDHKHTGFRLIVSGIDGASEKGLKLVGAKLAKARSDGMPPDLRKRIAQKAARGRWKRYRLQKAERERQLRGE